MRTKTMILSGVIAALASASAMAQVYSLNAVGYINVTVKSASDSTGWSMIADQLWANGAGVNNYISPTLDAQLLDGNHNGVTIFKYSAVNGFTVIGTVVGISQGVSSWAPATNITSLTANAGNTTLNPGEGIFLYCPQSVPDFTLTFVGTVPQTSGSLPGVPINGSGNNGGTNYTGFQITSSVVPQASDLVSMGLTPTAGDTVFMWDPVNGYDAIYTWVTVGQNGSWATSATPALPTPNVGQAFLYNTPALNAEVWNRTFTVQ